MLYSVIILSCSLAMPMNCRRDYVGDVKTPTPIGCLMGAQPYLREWIVQNSHRHFIKLTCVDHRRLDYYLGRNEA